MPVKNMDVHAAQALIETEPELVILDVRTPGEFELFFIKGAINIDAQGPHFEEAVGALDKTKKYLVHCQSGERSKAAIETLAKLGFTDLIHMHEGMREWNYRELPVIYNWTI